MRWSRRPISSTVFWRARAWNMPAVELFTDWLGGPEPCLLAYVFLNRAARAFIVDWENRARRLAAELRADTGRNPHDPGLRALVDRLLTGSKDFSTFWSDHAVPAREGGERSFNHPRAELQRYEQATLSPAGRPDAKLVILIPSPDAKAKGAKNQDAPTSGGSSKRLATSRSGAPGSRSRR
jgi:hypothetical protein